MFSMFVWSISSCNNCFFPNFVCSIYNHIVDLFQRLSRTSVRIQRTDQGPRIQLRETPKQVSSVTTTSKGCLQFIFISVVASYINLVYTYPQIYDLFLFFLL